MAKSDISKLIPTSYDRIHNKPMFNYGITLLITATLIVSILALINTNQLKKTVAPTGNAVSDANTISVDDFLKRLTSHNEMKSYVGAAPLNIIQINNNNLASLQAQINGIDISHIGNYLIQYSDRIVVYDYGRDLLRGTVTLQQPKQTPLPADFFTKVNSHNELQGLQNQQPVGGQLDESTLNTLKQQFPDVYANAKVGDFLLRYETRLIIYDYNNDRVINVVNLG